MIPTSPLITSLAAMKRVTICERRICLYLLQATSTIVQEPHYDCEPLSMVHIPRSRTTSLARSSPSRLIVPPALKPSPSLSNLNIHSHNPGPSQPDPAPSSLARSNVLDSSASSVISVDMNEGILIQDMDADVEPTDDTAVLAQFDANQSEEGPKKHLRDQLRRTLTSKALQSG